MEKKVVNTTVKEVEYYDDEVDISVFEALVQESKNNGATKMLIESEYDSGTVKICFYNERMETDEEFAKRKYASDKRLEMQEQQERRQYELLKRKFDPA